MERSYTSRASIARIHRDWRHVWKEQKRSILMVWSVVVRLAVTSFWLLQMRVLMMLLMLVHVHLFLAIVLECLLLMVMRLVTDETDVDILCRMSSPKWNKIHLAAVVEIFSFVFRVVASIIGGTFFVFVSRIQKVLLAAIVTELQKTILLLLLAALRSFVEITLEHRIQFQIWQCRASSPQH